jgi:hypothetical protein
MRQANATTRLVSYCNAYQALLLTVAAGRREPRGWLGESYIDDDGLDLCNDQYDINSYRVYEVPD